MDLILDTHTFLWYTGGKPELSDYARELIEDRANTKWVSIASPWEIAIKASTARGIELHVPFAELFPNQLFSNGFELLTISWPHLRQVASLPLHHRDPFDRLIIAQSLAEDMPVVSADSAFDAYGVSRLWQTPTP